MGACGGQRQGTLVNLITVKALLTESALARLKPAAFHFCAQADCDIVYFDQTGWAT